MTALEIFLSVYGGLLVGTVAWNVWVLPRRYLRRRARRQGR
jgi:hypothetical protein